VEEGHSQTGTATTFAREAAAASAWDGPVVRGE
jgi:ABC-type polar amino acid transport system ATPase subunit